MVAPFATPNVATADADAEGPILALAQRVTVRSSANDISAARSKLTQAISANESYLHDITHSHTSVMANHLDQNAKLKQRSDVAQRAAQALADDFDVGSLDRVHRLEKFRVTTSNIHTSLQGQALAGASREILEDLKQRYDLLVRVEDGVWCGRGADPSTVAAVAQFNCDEQRSTGAAVQTALAARCAVLRATVTEQLSNAWNLAVTVSISAEGLPSVMVASSFTLSAPKAPRSTPYATSVVKAPRYDFVNLCKALQTLKVLPGLLHDLHSCVVRKVIEPLLSHDSWRPSKCSRNDGIGLETVSVSSQNRRDLIQNVKVVLDFFHQALPDECRVFNVRLQEAAFSLVLDRILIPSLPTPLANLPEWLELALQAADWEGSFSADEADPGVIHAFLNDSAGGVWLQKRKAVSLSQARRIAYSTWSSWASKTVQPDVVPPMSAQPKAQALVKTDDEDGWGFEEESQLRLGSHRAAIQAEAAENDGWDFDDIADEPAPSPAPAPPMVHRDAPKPREARRLGKKAAPKGTRLSSATPSPPPLSSPSANATVASFTPSDRRVSEPEAPALSETFKVSMATDAVMDLTATALKELMDISNIREAPFCITSPLTQTYVNIEVYHTVLGKLVEATVSSILLSVLALEDITELESQRIGDLLSLVETLSNLFQNDQAHVSTVAAFVPHWIKFGYLNELLHAKLIEITNLYDNGSLVDFTSDELGGLVRALFADSPQRTILLERVAM
ncbi:hypothetical protein CC85DRAFT_311819 [Cutaneotrichosporon oleaginosum]|uniref:ZW10 C-terminal helical domain-containing protein n=1 Tax=Cutaneotrichosporon oleaginosum TaxID=879819 RepID=A0A0J0XPW7_9TREE|nr:uncharacterized protein CC85DRAFT_311819 [Cutaneotrichosporon oleaginosum]KLT43176.1 hypothetical protein CC85DRAFT_311819 [Cutaneotrichosporon oleaginosum]TXT09858.1 hypothetical protein COLE_03792 [Cutaneotrichosporon oleaginosum]